METTLGLRSGGGDAGGGTKTASLNAKVEKGCMGMSKETELELGLGLSLGNSGGAVAKEKEKEKGGSGSHAWGEYGRILTAKDFPSGFAAVSGTKRERAASDCAEGGSASAGVSQVVGWPPVRAYRMSTLFNQAKTSNVEEEKGVGGNEKTDQNSNKKMNHGTEKNEAVAKERGHLGFVKVNMDGQPIGRKVDLNTHKSYETLAKTLEEMFFKPPSTILGLGGGNDQSVQPSKLLDSSSEFVLTYEDKEGDWMLVGDVPWGMFTGTVKRLRIMRTSEASGLAPKFQGKNDKPKGRPI